MQATQQMIRTMTAENSIEVETVAPTVPTWTEEEETKFQTAYTTALSLLSARLGARDIELSEATIGRMKNPKLLAELRDFRRNPKKVILCLVGSAGQMWGSYSEEYQVAFISAFVAQWGAENIMIVIGGNSGTGVTCLTTTLVKTEFPAIRLISMIPVVNKATGLAICGMGVNLYDATGASINGSLTLPPGPPKDATSGATADYWLHSFSTDGAGELLVDPMPGAWENHTVWPLNIEGGGRGRQQIMAFLMNFFLARLGVLEGGPGTLNEVQAFVEKTESNPNPTICSFVNSTYLFSLLQGELATKNQKINELEALAVAFAAEKVEMLASFGAEKAALKAEFATAMEATWDDIVKIVK